MDVPAMEEPPQNGFGVIDGPLLGYDSNWSDLNSRISQQKNAEKEHFKQIVGNEVPKTKTLPKVLRQFKPHQEEDDGPQQDPDAALSEWTDGSDKENSVDNANTIKQKKVEVAAKKKYVSPQPACFRCVEPVYPQELVEPKKGVVYHNSCFKCIRCGLKLNLSSFHTNQNDPSDTDVYCRPHAPQLCPGKVDLASIHRNGSTVNHTRTTQQVRCPPQMDSLDNGHRLSSGIKGPSILSVSSSLTPPRDDVIKSEAIGLRYF